MQKVLLLTGILLIITVLVLGLKQLFSGEHEKLNRSLFIRAGLSLTLIVVVVISYYAGWIKPAGTVVYL